MLRSRFSSSSSRTFVTTKQARLSLSPTLFPHQHTQRSAKSHKQPTAFEERQRVEQRAATLDSKASCWTLTQDDVEEAVDLLHGIGTGKIDLSIPTSVPEGKAGKNEDDDSGSNNNTILYIDPKNPTTESAAVAVPYAMSALQRVLFSYPHWYTLGAPDPTPPASSPSSSSSDSSKDDDGGIFALKRPGGTPERSLRYKAVNLCSVPATSSASESDVNRLFVVGSSPERLDVFRSEQERKHGGVHHLPKLSGYELYAFARMALASNKQLKFCGISFNPSRERFMVLANNESAQLVAQTICSGMFLETALVLLKWMVEEAEGQGLKGERAFWIASCVKQVLVDGTYFLFRDKDDVSFLFTSMHHLLLYKNLALATEAGRAEFERRGPWKIFTTSGKNINWKADERCGPVVNPAVPEVAKHVPVFNIQFSRQGIEQMLGILKQLKMG